jgi:hypothetical protein
VTRAGGTPSWAGTLRYHAAARAGVTPRSPKTGLFSAPPLEADMTDAPNAFESARNRHADVVV